MPFIHVKNRSVEFIMQIMMVKNYQAKYYVSFVCLTQHFFHLYFALIYTPKGITMDIERSIEYYDSRVKDLKPEDITSDEYDAEILHKLRDNDPDFRWIFLTDVGGGFSEDNDNFIMGVDDDLGWLGYLIGRNSQLKHLTISISNSILGNRSLSLSQIDALAQ